MSTICAISTAKGGAIGVIRVSGEEAINISDKIFNGRKPLSSAQSYSLHYGKIVDEKNEIIDEVIVSVFRNPNSFTGEDSTEISCHGSNYILGRVVELLIANGCTMAMPGEFTKRAFLNGKMDLSQAEAVADLIAASSASAHKIAMTQMRGEFSNKLSILRGKLLEMTSLLELELDFSEEDVEFADRKKLRDLAEEIRKEIVYLSNSYSKGNVIKNGIPVAIIGAANVGKSTLLNALLHEERAIVSDIEGTTRDIIEDTVNIGGALFRFIDTAGIRHTDNKIEKMGIERSIKAADSAHIILLMTEPGVPFPKITPKDDQIVIEIINKSDAFQALNGMGLDWLEQELINCIPNINENDVLVTNIRHKQALDHSLAAIDRSINSIDFQLSGDLISEDLRQCISALSEITGHISNDEVLANIFKNFCIGK